MVDFEFNESKQYGVVIALRTNSEHEVADAKIIAKNYMSEFIPGELMHRLKFFTRESMSIDHPYTLACKYSPQPAKCKS